MRRYEKTIRVEHGYLYFRTNLHKPLIPVEIMVDGKHGRLPYAHLSDDGKDFFTLNVREYVGREITVILENAEGIDVAKAFDEIHDGPALQEGNPYCADLYEERYRPRAHFTTRRGWSNDANGMIWANGMYHLYYQHNQMGVNMDSMNISWGHAVSPDLVHWEEKDDVMPAYRPGLVSASGSAIRDSENLLGFGSDAIVAAVSVFGTRIAPNVNIWLAMPAGTLLAVSTDGGDSFHWEVTPAIAVPQFKLYRDPCIFRANGMYYIALFENRDEGNCVGFYSSQNLRDWKYIGVTKDLYECPDIFTCGVYADGSDRWVLYGADGRARIGRFDGVHFIDGAFSNLLDFGNTVYAGQTFKDDPQGRHIYMPWIGGMFGTALRKDRHDSYIGYPDMCFSQTFGLPSHLWVKNVRGTEVVCRTPVEELKGLRDEELPEQQVDLTDRYVVDGNKTAEYEIRFRGSGPVELNVLDATIRFDASNGVVHFSDTGDALVPEGEGLIRVFTDRTSIEIYFNDVCCASYSLNDECRKVCLHAKGVSAQIKGWLLKNWYVKRA